MTPIRVFDQLLTKVPFVEPKLTHPNNMEYISLLLSLLVINLTITSEKLTLLLALYGMSQIILLHYQQSICKPVQSSAYVITRKQIWLSLVLIGLLSQMWQKLCLKFMKIKHVEHRHSLNHANSSKHLHESSFQCT